MDDVLEVPAQKNICAVDRRHGDVVGALSPLLDAPPDVRVYTVA